MKLSKLSKILGLTTAFAISSQAALLIQQNKALAGTGTSTLYTGEYLFANQYLISHNGAFKAIQQSDGNFVLYYYKIPLWASNKDGLSVYYTIMQTDCNLVSYNYSGKPVWASNTDGQGYSCRLEV
ncbi:MULTISPECIES: hypothetical protein [unclassified Nostoc]|nr:hypothetical protein [Nostoc sp. S13]MDF5738095.1 hypothetical protein [Nostoc sp. S13]